MALNPRLETIITLPDTNPEVRQFDRGRLASMMEGFGADIQSNILIPHHGHFHIYLFMRFNSEIKEWKALIKNLAEGSAPELGLMRITSLEQQFSNLGGVEQSMANFMLSKTGYKKLDFSDLSSMDKSFQAGTRSESVMGRLGDRPTVEWEAPYQNPWDALLLLSGDNRADLVAKLKGLVQLMSSRRLTSTGSQSGTSNLAKAWPPVPGTTASTDSQNSVNLDGNFPDLHIELGNAIGRDGEIANMGPGDAFPKERYEIFGFRDGISQPIFLEDQWARVETRYGQGDSPVPLKPGADPRSPLSLVLTDDPFRKDAFGSYFVFRKLEQDYKVFKETIDGYRLKLEEKWTVKGASRLEYLKKLYLDKSSGQGRSSIFDEIHGGEATSKEPLSRDEFLDVSIMGRKKDGTPFENLVPNGKVLGEDNFDYTDRKSGCPFGNHGMKANPRGLSGNLQDERKRKIARRGTPYGSRTSKEAGMLFLCAQASIAEQFEFIQSNWLKGYSSNPEGKMLPGTDALVGWNHNEYKDPGDISELTMDQLRMDQTNRSARANWIKDTVDFPVSVAGSVKYQGGEYFFAPSISFLTSL